MRLTYYVSLADDTYVQTYFAKIVGRDPKYGFKRIFMEPDDTYDFKKERAYFHTITDAGVYEQSIKVFSKKTGKLIRRERKYFLYDKSCLHEIQRCDIFILLKKVRELSTL